MHEIFASEYPSITAAKQATDGSQLLAVTDSRFIFIQDTRQEIVRRRHAFSDASGPIQLLHFARNTQELYFTTALQNAVRCYSVRSGILLKPVCELPRPPAVFAVSKRYLIAACNGPTLLLHRSLSSNATSVTFKTLASPAAIILVNLHHEQHNMFLIAFADGSISVHNAAYIHRRTSTNGQVAFIERQRHQDQTPAPGIRAAEFMPGATLQLAVLGSDQSFRVISLHRGIPLISHIWTMPLMASCIAVCPESFRGQQYIAVGNPDGEVAYLDIHGNLIHKMTVGQRGESVLDLEWVPAESPVLPPRYAAEDLRPLSPEESDQQRSQESLNTVVVHSQHDANLVIDGPATEPDRKVGILHKFKLKTLQKRKPSIVIEEDEDSPSPTAPRSMQRDYIDDVPRPLTITKYATTGRHPEMVPTDTEPRHASTARLANSEAVQISNVEALDGTGTTDESAISIERDEHLHSLQRGIRCRRFGRIEPSLLPPPLPTVEVLPPEDFHDEAPSQETKLLCNDPAVESEATNSSLTRDEANLRGDSSMSDITTSSTEAQDVDRKRKLPLPQQPVPHSAADRNPFVRAHCQRSNVQVREAFAGFSSVSTVASVSPSIKTLSTAEISVRTEMRKSRNHVTALRGELVALNQGLDELRASVQAKQSHQSTTSVHSVRHVTGRQNHFSHHCCAINILEALVERRHDRACPCLRDRLVGHSTLNDHVMPLSGQTHCPAPSSRHRRVSDPSSTSSSSRSSSAPTTSLQSSGADQTFPATRRRHRHRHNRAGWIRVGKFQVRRVSRDGKGGGRRTERRMART